MKNNTMPTDPTPLTEAEIRRIEELRNHATQTPLIDAELYFCVLDRIPALLAAARENAKAQAAARDYGQAFMLVWGMVMPENSAYTGCTQSAAEVLRHEVDLMRQSNKELARENAGLREELSKTLNDTTWQDHADAWRKRCVTLTAERDAALARVAELERYVEQLREPLLQEATDLGQEIESVTPPPDPKWVRCPAGCSEGRLMVYGYPAGKCNKCDSSYRPGWVQETPQ